MKISAIDDQLAAALDAEEHFIVREVLDVSLTKQRFGLSVRSVAPYQKDYMSTDETDEFDGDYSCYGAFIGHEIAGKIVLGSTWNALAAIENVVVSHAHRSKGVATRLIEFAKDWTVRRGLLGIRLETQTNNVPACNLYAKCGFSLGGIDLLTYRTRAQVAGETAMYWYWFPETQNGA